MQDISQRIIYLTNRLQQLRKEWINASPAKKKYIEVGAKLLKDEKNHLEKKLASVEEIKRNPPMF